MLLIANAAALEPSGQFRSGQNILINNGKIAAVGQHLPAEGCEVLDAQGAFVTPGLIDAHCHVGLLEDSAGSAGRRRQRDRRSRYAAAAAQWTESIRATVRFAMRLRRV